MKLCSLLAPRWSGWGGRLHPAKPSGLSTPVGVRLGAEAGRVGRRAALAVSARGTGAAAGCSIRDQPQPPTTNDTTDLSSQNALSSHHPVVSSVGWDMPPLALAPPRSRSRSRSLAVAYGGGGRCGGGAWRNSLAHGGGGDGCVEERSPSARDSKRTTRDATADGPCPPARAVRRAALTQARGAPVGERARAPTEKAPPPNRERRGSSARGRRVLVPSSPTAAGPGGRARDGRRAAHRTTDARARRRPRR